MRSAGLNLSTVAFMPMAENEFWLENRTALLQTVTACCWNKESLSNAPMTVYQLLLDRHTSTIFSLFLVGFMGGSVSSILQFFVSILSFSGPNV